MMSVDLINSQNVIQKLTLSIHIQLCLRSQISETLAVMFI